MNKKAMYAISYGLFVVTACRDGKDNGCITNTVIQLTSEPNRISVAVNKSNYTSDRSSEHLLLSFSCAMEVDDYRTIHHLRAEGNRNNVWTGHPDSHRITAEQNIEDLLQIRHFSVFPSHLSTSAIGFPAETVLLYLFGSTNNISPSLFQSLTRGAYRSDK